MNGKIKIENVSMPTANTEYSFALPSGVKRFSIKLRDLGYILKICFVSGDVNNYITLISGKTYSENEIKGGGTLYFKSPSSNQTAEIIYIS